MGPQRLHALQQNQATVDRATFDRATYNRPAGGKFFKLYLKFNFLKISRNMAAPQQIEQVRLPSVCTCFPET
jgi:hypothetical protein